MDLTSSVGQNIFSLIKVIMSPKGKKSNDRNAYRLITNNIFVFFFRKKGSVCCQKRLLSTDINQPKCSSPESGQIYFAIILVQRILAGEYHLDIICSLVQAISLPDFF